MVSHCFISISLIILKLKKSSFANCLVLFFFQELSVHIPFKKPFLFIFILISWSTTHIRIIKYIINPCYKYFPSLSFVYTKVLNTYVV